jgi:hypothetical protein
MPPIYSSENTNFGIYLGTIKQRASISLTNAIEHEDASELHFLWMAPLKRLCHLAAVALAPVSAAFNLLAATSYGIAALSCYSYQKSDYILLAKQHGTLALYDLTLDNLFHLVNLLLPTIVFKRSINQDTRKYDPYFTNKTMDRVVNLFTHYTIFFEETGGHYLYNENHQKEILHIDYSEDNLEMDYSSSLGDSHSFIDLTAPATPKKSVENSDDDQNTSSELFDSFVGTDPAIRGLQFLAEQRYRVDQANHAQPYQEPLPSLLERLRKEQEAS